MSNIWWRPCKNTTSLYVSSRLQGLTGMFRDYTTEWGKTRSVIQFLLCAYMFTFTTFSKCECEMWMGFMCSHLWGSFASGAGWTRHRIFIGTARTTRCVSSDTPWLVLLEGNPSLKELPACRSRTPPPSVRAEWWHDESEITGWGDWNEVFI